MNTQELVTQATSGSGIVSVDGGDSGQCTAIPHLFELGNDWPLILGNAVDTPTNALQYPDYYQVIAYTSAFIPVDGDIPVWNGNWGSGNGHTAVTVVYGSYVANVSTLYVLEQNDGDAGKAHVAQHNYSDIDHFIRPLKYNQGDIMNADVVTSMFRMGFHRDPTAEELTGWTNRTVGDLLNAEMTNVEWLQGAGLSGVSQAVVDSLVRGVLDREPTSDDYNKYVGQTLDFTLSDLISQQVPVVEQSVDPTPTDPTPVVSTPTGSLNVTVIPAPVTVTPPTTGSATIPKQSFGQIVKNFFKSLIGKD